ncbi:MULTISPECIES: hypothetical protein [Bacillus cereus group]|uniref:hypothetical protein n=1 Tax=Bacillus cereus group TaxID=86661 RepID=UPI002DBC8EB3|nr:hypothetical protein [Bacillus thuringiensis]MEC3270780.1 hypothetical protein [Bacillus thuringiensis]
MVKLTLYIVLKCMSIGFGLITVLLLISVLPFLLFDGPPEILLKTPVFTLIAFLVCAFIYIPINSNYEKKAIVEKLQLKDVTEIESIHTIDRHNRSLKEVKIKNVFYHVTLGSEKLVPTVSKIEKINEKK